MKDDVLKTKDERLEELKAYMCVIPRSPEELDKQVAYLQEFMEENSDLKPFLLIEAKKDYVRLKRKFEELYG